MQIALQPRHISGNISSEKKKKGERFQARNTAVHVLRSRYQSRRKFSDNGYLCRRWFCNSLFLSPSAILPAKKAQLSDKLACRCALPGSV